jgi:hypothetical protein
LVKSLRYFRRCNDILLDIPINIFPIHINSDPHLIGFFAWCRISSKSPTCHIAFLIQFAVSYHTVAAVIGYKKFVFSLLFLKRIWIVIKRNYAYSDCILGRVNNSNSKVVLSFERQNILTQYRRPSFYLRLFCDKVVLDYVKSSKCIKVALADF